MTPRTMLVTVPHALRVATVNGASGGTITGKVSIGTGHTNTGHNTLVAGYYSKVTGHQATVAGGWADSATANESSVGGGAGNWAGGYASTVAGGQENIAGGAHATVAGGGGYPLGNVSGGIGSTIGGGTRNAAPGDASTIPGGVDNSTQGRFAFAAGRRAKALHDGAFVWGDTTESDFGSTGPNQFLIRAGGGVGIGTATPVAALDVNGSVAVGSGTPIQKILGASAVLNFPSVASLGSAELNITVTGAGDGDIVSLGIPVGSISAGANYWGYVSSPNAVTIRFTNASVVAANPASGTFRAMVTKFLADDGPLTDRTGALPRITCSSVCDGA